MIQVRLTEQEMFLPVRVTPKGGKDCILPFQDGDTVLKLKVSAPPEGGKANMAVIQVIADALSLPKSRIRIHRGDKSREKQVALSVSGTEECEALIAKLQHTHQIYLS